MNHRNSPHSIAAHALDHAKLLSHPKFIPYILFLFDANLVLKWRIWEVSWVVWFFAAICIIVNPKVHTLNVFICCILAEIFAFAYPLRWFVYGEVYVLNKMMNSSVSKNLMPKVTHLVVSTSFYVLLCTCRECGVRVREHPSLPRCFQPLAV